MLQRHPTAGPALAAQALHAYYQRFLMGTQISTWHCMEPPTSPVLQLQ
jgi:hypothetical protein